MLTFLQVNNLALLKEATLQPGSGFIALTGETGAGKSVLLGALSILAGSRVDKTVIGRHGESTEVEASLFFEDTKRLDTLLIAADLPACEEGSLLLRRSIGRKQSRISVNGKITTLAVLQSIGELWIDFHGPGEPQKLFRESFQLECLDQYADTEEALRNYREDFEARERLLKERDQLSQTALISPEETTFLRQQAELIRSVDPTDQRIEDLETKYRRISNGKATLELCSRLTNKIIDDQGLADLAGRLVADSRELEHLEPTTSELRNRVEGVSVELDDIAREYQRFAETFELDEEAIAEIEATMARWLDLKRKYGGTPSKVRAHLKSLEEKLDLLGSLNERLHSLDHEISKRESALHSMAEAISKARRSAALQLSKSVTDLLSHLGFKKALFEIEVVPQPELSRSGNTVCSFRFAPNPGEPPAPLNRIASSGETARVMLALKAILATIDQTPVLVFDEVDANVGGEIGAVVGRQLQVLGDGRQVLCVTHLPQVASLAREHYLVSKVIEEDQTSVTIARIDREPTLRRNEIARMLGDRSSRSALEHADALLS